MAKNTLWFRSKSYGWGWTPVTWQGWVITGIYVVFLVNTFLEIDYQLMSFRGFFTNWLGNFVIYTAVFIAICLAKGEKPTWRWGSKKVKS